MRDALKVLQSRQVPSNLGLGYGAWAPVATEGDHVGEVPPDIRADWLEKLERLPLDDDYKAAFESWKDSFGPRDRLGKFQLTSRLLVGHGNSSPTEVGLTVHHTWGVPIIPGSALKGLAAHYLETVYGPADHTIAPWCQEGDERDRARFQGVYRAGADIKRGPGPVYRRLFGAPASPEDDDAQKAFGTPSLAGEARGEVTFHDALFDPSSEKKLFAMDVLTVHQRRYYGQLAGTSKPGEHWPNDFDDPNPVQFLTVSPTAQFLVALSGPDELTKLAGKLLSEALNDWGVGGKTSAGYGRGTLDRFWKPENAELKVFLELVKSLKKGENWRSTFTKLTTDNSNQLRAMSDEDFAKARTAIELKIKAPNILQYRDDLLNSLRKG